MWSQVLPDAVFVSPHAPFTCDIGMGRQWFSFQDREPAAVLEGARAAAGPLDAFIDAELELQLSDHLLNIREVRSDIGEVDGQAAPVRRGRFDPLDGDHVSGPVVAEKRNDALVAP